MKITLLFPPPGNPSQPYTSLPALTAFMRRAGYAVTQRDLGIEMVQDWLAPERLEQAGAQARARLASLERLPQPTPKEEAEREALAQVIVGAEYVSQHIAEAKRVLRSPTDFYDLARFRWSANLIGEAMSLLSANYWPSSFSFNHGLTKYVMPGYGWSACDLLAAAADEKQNICLSYFERTSVPSILAESPDLVGISATYPGQLIPALTLARLLKAARPSLHICLGGAVLATVQQELLRSPLLFSVVDSIVVCDGEHALLALARALEGDGDLSAIPNLLYLDGQQVRFTSLYVEDVNALPSPDYAGLPLKLYLTPHITALLPTERGCYWGQCAFCTVSFGMRHAYRPRKIELVVADMKSLHQQLGTRCFFLSTDAISPARMKALAQALATEGLGFHWQTEARLENALTLEMCQVLAQGGCRHLRMGLESGAQPVLDAMDKGLRVEDAAQIIQNCHAAGISVHTCLILGFPSETRDQARQTWAFVEANREAIASATCAMFALYKDSPVYHAPERFGITHIQPPPSDSLNSNAPAYATSLGMSRAEAEGEAYEEGARVLSRVLPFALPLTGCYVAAAHPLHFFTHWAYLPYLAHYGVTHYRDLPEALCPPQPASTEQALALRPVLTEGVLSRASDGRRLALFDPQQGRAISVAAETQGLLALCDGRSTVREIAERLSVGRQGVDRLRAYFHGLGLGALLLREGFLTASDEKGGRGS